MRIEIVCQNGHQFMTQAEGEDLAKLRCGKCEAPMMTGVATPLADAPFEHISGGAAWWSESVTSLVATLAWATEAAACVSWERALAALRDLWEIQAVVDVLIGLVPYELRRKLAPNKIVKTWELLPISLTEEQTAAAGREMAKIALGIENLEEEKAAAAASFNSRLKDLHSRLGELGRGVREGNSVRTTVAMEFDYRLGTVTKSRTDTGEVLSERPMTGEERDEHRQEKMFDDASNGRSRRRKGDDAQPEATA